MRTTERNTVSKIVPSEARLRAAIAEAVTQSAWFEVTPLPDDEWRLTMKDESTARRVFAVAGPPRMTPEAALAAIRARLQGEFDQPDLVAFGPLSDDAVADVLAIAACVPEETATDRAA